MSRSSCAEYKSPALDQELIAADHEKMFPLFPGAAEAGDTHTQKRLPGRDLELVVPSFKLSPESEPISVMIQRLSCKVARI